MLLKEQFKFVRRDNETSGTNHNTGKDWRRQQVILATIEEDPKYSKEIAMTAFGEDRIKCWYDVKEGDVVEVSFDINSRLYNGRYYTDINAVMMQNLSKIATKVAMANAYAPKAAPAPDVAPAAPAPASKKKAAPAAPAVDDPKDDLPF